MALGCVVLSLLLTVDELVASCKVNCRARFSTHPPRIFAKSSCTTTFSQTTLACLSCIYEADEEELTREKHIAQHLGVSVEDVRTDRISESAAEHIVVMHTQLRAEEPDRNCVRYIVQDALRRGSASDVRRQASGCPLRFRIGTSRNVARVGSSASSRARLSLSRLQLLAPQSLASCRPATKDHTTKTNRLCILRRSHSQGSEFGPMGSMSRPPPNR